MDIGSPVPPSVERALDQAEAALEHGDIDQTLALCEEVLGKHPDHPGAWFLSAEAFRDLRDLQQAEARYRRTTHLTADYSPGWSGLGTCLFDLLRFDESRRCANRAIRLDPFNPEAYYLRALIRERRGDFPGTERDFHRAHRLDSEGYPRPIPLDDAAIEAIVVEAISELHPTIQSYLSQVAILLEEIPDIEVCQQYEPPAPPGEILGFFSGTSLSEQSIENPWSNFPSSIVLFRRNLERIAWKRERMIAELRITVFHEIGHFLGLDEEDLLARGLD